MESKRFLNVSIIGQRAIKNEKPVAAQRVFEMWYYSHSIVPMGLGVRSMRTRLMPSTSWVIR